MRPVGLIVFLLGPVLSHADGVQTPGPDGGPVYAAVASGPHLVLGGDYGLFLSPDIGENWHEDLSDLTAIRINALITKGATLFAGTWGKGVIRSDDDGITWVKTGLNSTIVKGFLIVRNALYVGTDAGVFRTNDDGQSWVLLNNGLANTDVRSLAISGSILFAGTAGGVFRSDDGGANWSPISSELTNQVINTLTFVGSRLFAGTNGGLFVSIDNGTSWRKISKGLRNTRVNTLFGAGMALYAGTEDDGLFRLISTGTPWESINTGLTSMTAVRWCQTGRRCLLGRVKVYFAR